MKAFEKAMQRMYDRNHRPVHTVVRYNYTMEESREFLLKKVKAEKTTAFEKIFDICENRIHALFLFLSLLELTQAKYMFIITGEGRNNFIIEFNENREEEIQFEVPPANPA
jgi:segregation and condensation protein A